MKQQTLPIPYPEFVSKLVKPGENILAYQTANTCDLLHMAIGISGEASELMVPIRSYCMHGNRLDMTNVIEELGDQEFFLEHARFILGIDRTECLGGKKITINPVHPYTSKLVEAAVLNVICAGDFLDAVKKWAIYEKPFGECKPKMIEAMIGMESALWYIRDLVQVPRTNCLIANEEKLMKRYTSLSYTDAEAQARADKPQE